MFNGQKRIAIITAMVVLATSQLCYAEEISDVDQAEISQEVAVCSSENVGESFDIGILGVEDTVILDGESDYSTVLTVVLPNTYVAGMKVDIRCLFSGTSGIVGYRSSNKSVAYCKKNGTIKGKSTGTTHIEAYNSSKTTVSSVDIHIVKQKLYFPKDLSTPSFNAAEYLTDSKFIPAEWESSKPSVATVDKNTGLVMVKGRGKTKISAIYKDNGSTKKITGILKVKNISSDSSAADGKRSVTIDTESGKTTVNVKYLASESDKVFDQVNKYRVQNSLPAFGRNIELQKAADIRAAELVKKFDHQRPNGTMCEEIFPAHIAAAENIAMGQKNAASVMKAWKNSPGHNANMLNKYCTCLAVSCVSYRGQKYWVQCFFAPYNPSK